MRYYCTYFDRNYLSRGLALVESLRHHESSPFVLFVVCMDEVTRAVLSQLAVPEIRPIPLHEIERRDTALLETREARSLVEYYWTMTPTIILRILERHPKIDLLTYLDADLFFFSSPQPIFDELGRDSILIHEHRFSPSQAELGRHNGRFNVGLLCFRRDRNSMDALRWWRARCLEWCFARYEEGKMGDQLYLEDWPARFQGVRVLQHPGGGVGPWNHDRYHLQAATNGRIAVDGAPLIFYHFHSLKSAGSDLAIPVAHSHYRLTIPVLTHCFLPYLEMLDQAQQRLADVVPGRRWGVEQSLDIPPQLSVLARRALAEKLAPVTSVYRKVSLNHEWDAYCSEQVIDRTDAAPAAMKPTSKEHPMLDGPTQHDQLLSLGQSSVAQNIRTIYVVGAHRYQEQHLFNRLFPNVEHIYLFEPLKELAQALMRVEASDPRVRVFPFALSDQSGEQDFYVTNNDGESSSLLRLGAHREIFPHVKEVGITKVQCRRLDQVIQEYGLPMPDLLLLDVQGAEYKILSSLSSSLKRHIQVLYVEASLEEVYQGARCLDDLTSLLAESHRLASFAPLSTESPTHGNALFLNSRCPEQPPAELDQHTVTEGPLISVIVSSYCAEAFMRECLDDLTSQTMAMRMEVIIVDAASPERERDIVLECQQGHPAHPQITYVRTPSRIGVYAAWNHALRLARGRYVTPFSTNDRLSPTAYERLAEALDKHQDVALVYGDTYLTDRPHQTFDRHHRTGVWQWPEYNYHELLRKCGVGPHPMWRRAVHDTVGYFDESYVALGDQDFWIRLGAQHRLLHIPVVTGLYWRSPEGLSNRAEIAGPEERRLRSTYLASAEAVHPLSAVEAEAKYDCSVIIPVWNRCELTRDCLTALAKTTEGLSWELIVVDNNSTDGTQAFLSSLGGDVQVIRNQENLGFAKACNQGAQAARGKYLVFLNNDTVPLDGWLRALVAEVDGHPEVGIAGSKLLYGDGTVQHAGVVFLRSQLSPYHIYSKASADLPAVNVRREFQVVTGACMLVRSQLFNELGGFHEGFRNGFEDVDLCLRAREKGYRVVYQPRSVLYHLESQTPGRKLHEADNARLLRERWGSHWWLADEDLHYHADGFKLVGSEATGEYVGHVQLIKDVKDRAAWAHVAAAQSAAQKKDWSGVKRELSLVQDWPNDPYVLSWAAKVCEQLDEPALRHTFLTRYLELNDSPAVRRSLVRSLLTHKSFAAAEQQLNTLLAGSPDDAEGLLLRGLLCMQREQYREAETAFSSAMRQGADRKKCLMGMGMASLGRAYAQGAWERFIEVLADNPNDADAIHWLIRAGTAQNRWEDLRLQLRAYVLRNPRDLATRFALAGVLLRADQIEEARREHDILRASDPTYDGLKELEEAIVRKETVLAMDGASLVNGEA